MALSRHTALMIKKRVFVVGIQAEWRGEETVRGLGGYIWLPPCLLMQQRNSDSEPGKFRPRRVNGNKRKDNRSLLGKKKRQQQRKADLLILRSGRTADHQLRHFKRPLAQLPSPSPEAPAERTS